MSIRTQIAAAAGALALIALVPTPAQASTYTVAPNLSSYNVSCRSGESFGTAPVRLRVTNDDTTATRWVTTWLGGSGGTITMTAEGRYFSADPGATFPCPEQQSEEGQIKLSVQAWAGEVKIGDPVEVRILVRRVGSASGATAVGPDGRGLVTSVLGLRLGAPDGPTPVGGVQTGAGGTSPRSTDPLLPLGAGLGFAGLAAAVMIRRRRRPTV